MYLLAPPVDVFFTIGMVHVWITDSDMFTSHTTRHPALSLQSEGVLIEARKIRFCRCCLNRKSRMMRRSHHQPVFLSKDHNRLSKSTPIQTTFHHPVHQEVECHERGLPKDKQVTEASCR